MTILHKSKKWVIGVTSASLMVMTALPVYAVNLQDVYRQAVNSDQTLKVSLAELKQEAELVPQAWSLALPNIEATGTASLSHSDATTNGTVGDSSAATTSSTTRAVQYGITLEQTIFDSSVFSGIRVANNQVKSQYAAFQAEQQDLISRTIDAYLDVLEKEDLVTYAEAEERALLEQYRQADESFKVGVKTITDVYTAKAAYDGAVSQTIAAKNNLSNSYEALSVITGQVYKKLTPLSEDFPLATPDPANINQWVAWTNSNNATIAQYRYALDAARYKIRATRGQHLPSLGATLGYGGGISHDISDDGNSTTRSRTPAMAIQLTIPIFQGGEITSEVREAIADYEQAEALLEFNRREQVENARKAYLAVVSGVSQVKADRRTIVSDKSALDATIESYKVGTDTIVDVLNAEQQLYEDLSTYSINRYTYVEAIISLKQAAGTLNSTDIIKLNSWMAFPKDHQTALGKLEEYMKNNPPQINTLAAAQATQTQPVSPAAKQIQLERNKNS